MNTPTPIDDPAHWRQLVEEARHMADQLADPETRQMMLEIAASYEELAKIAEARAARVVGDPVPLASADQRHPKR
jgi:hypothetical protein